jgi:uncharacterized protein
VYRWLEGVALVAVLICAGTVRAEAQMNSATPFDSTPDPHKTFPLIGGSTGGVPEDSLQVVTAAAANDANAVNAALDEQVSPDETESYGRTALIYAAMNNNSEIAQTLVTRGAKVDVRDNLGQTALHWAAERGSINVMRVLLQSNAAVDAQNRQGLTPLMLAASSGQLDAVRLLLKYHANPNVSDYSGRDAISWAANHAAIVAALNTAEGR